MWVSVTRGLGTACPTGNTLSQAFQTTSVSQGFTSKQNFCELEILGSRENQGRKKSILIKFPIPACWQARGTFPSLPGLPPQPRPQAGTAPLGKMCPGGSEAQPCSAWHTALPHPPGREGKSMDMGTIWSWGFFQGSTEPFVQLPELFSPSLSLPLDSWDVNTAACAVSLLPHICTRGKSSTYRIAIRTGYFRGTSSPTVCRFSSSWECSPMGVNSILLL